MKREFQTTRSAQGDTVLDWQSNTIVDAMFYHAAQSPEMKLFTLLGDGENETASITAAELAQEAQILAAWLRRLAPAGARLMLLYDNGPDYIRGLMGCLCAGMIPVSGVYPRAFGARDRFLGIREDCGARGVIGSRAALAEFQAVCPDAPGAEPFLWIPTDRIRSTETFCASPADADLALIQYTSGSTRAPRGVMLTHRNISHNLFRQAETFGYRYGDCGVNWLPLSHDMGLIGGALMTLGAGGRCILVAPEHVAEKPIRWLRAVSRYQATLSGGPNFAYGLCTRSIDAAEVATLDLSSWKVAFNGAEYIRPETIREFSEHFAPARFSANAFFACYGLAEATLLVTATARDAGMSFRDFSREGLARGQAEPPSGTLDARPLVSCGAAPADIQLCVSDEKTETVLPDGQIGEIRVSGPGIGMGYVNRVAENMTVFQGEVAGEAGKWLRTGDSGFLLDGALYVTGRQDNRLHIGNRVFEPEDVIACLEAFAQEIRLFSTIVYVETLDAEPCLVVVTELPAIAPGDLAALGRAMGETLCTIYPVQGCRVIFLKAGGILKTPSGKLRVAQTRNEIMSGAIPVVSEHLHVAAGSARVRILKIEQGGI